MTARASFQHPFFPIAEINFSFGIAIELPHTRLLSYRKPHYCDTKIISPLKGGKIISGNAIPRAAMR